MKRHLTIGEISELHGLAGGRPIARNWKPLKLKNKAVSLLHVYREGNLLSMWVA